MAITLGKPSDKADRRDKPRPVRVAAKCGVCIVALLGLVVPATTFVARLASIRILPATQFAEDLIRGSLIRLLAQKCRDVEHLHAGLAHRLDGRISVSPSHHRRCFKLGIVHHFHRVSPGFHHT